MKRIILIIGIVASSSLSAFADNSAWIKWLKNHPVYRESQEEQSQEEQEDQDARITDLEDNLYKLQQQNDDLERRLNEISDR